jgi:hypothetical protein
MKRLKLTCSYEGGRVLEGSAHLKSRAFVSQSAAVACCMLSVSLSLCMPFDFACAGQFNVRYLPAPSASSYFSETKRGSKNTLLTPVKV